MITASAIQTIPPRLSEARALKLHLQQQREQHGKDFTITIAEDSRYDPENKRENRPRENWMLCLETCIGRAGKKGHSLIIQDDVVLHNDLLWVAEWLSYLFPSQPIALFNPNNRTFRDAYQGEPRLIEMQSGFWIQAMLIPNDMGREILQFNNRFDASFRHDDGILHRYCQWKDVYAVVHIPSLVQHAGWNRSTVGNPKQASGNKRRTVHFYPDKQFTGVNYAELKRSIERYPIPSGYNFKKELDEYFSA